MTFVSSPITFSGSRLPQQRVGNRSQYSIFFDAVRRSDTPTLKTMLTDRSKVLDINQICDNKGQKPLFLATMGDQPETVRLFLEHGADPNATSKVDHQTPLHLAAMYGLAAVGESLLQFKANPNAQDALGKAPLHWAISAKQNSMKLLQSLLASHANLNITNIWGETPLHIVARENHLEAAKLLLASGAKLSIRNHNNKTPLDVAIKGDHLEMARLLAQQTQSSFRGAFTLLMNKIVP